LIAIPGYAEFTYNADSSFESMISGNGMTTTYQYDSRNRPVNIYTQKDGTDFLLLNYQYDLGGSITQLEYGRRLPDQQWTQSLETFVYDSLDRLTSAQGDYGSLSYSYDPLGNRTSLNDLNYSYNAMNELLSISNGTVFAYDENGNLVTKTDGNDTWSYTYDTRNQLVQVEKNQQILTQYGYDGDGRRIQKTEWVDSLQEYQTTISVYSGMDVIYEKNVNTGQEATYVYGPAGRIAKKVGGLTDYYHTDHLGSTRLITDESGNTVTDVGYAPFGETLLNGEEDSHLYTGKERDGTGLYYYGARYYDPHIGRFMTRDTIRGDIKNPQSLNLYTYCLNNPLRYVDPLGFSPWDAVRDVFELLENLNPDTMGENFDIYLEQAGGDELTALMNLLDDLGFAVKMAGEGDRRRVIITININGTHYGTMPIHIDEQRAEDENAYGGRDLSGDAFVSIIKHNTIAELVTTILHEICHEVLKKVAPELNTAKEHFIIYAIQIMCMGKLIESQKTEERTNPYHPYSNIYVTYMQMHWVESFLIPFWKKLYGIPSILDEVST